MNFKKAIKTVNILLLIVIGSMELIGQCPNILTTNIDNNGLCTGDSFTISIFGIDLPGGGTIDYFLGTSSGFDPYEGEGDYIGSADITTPCVQGPTILFALIDPPPGPDRCDEYLVIHTGSGLPNIDDIIVNTNVGFNPFVSGNPNNFTGCALTVLNPGDPVPPNVILIMQGAFNTSDGDIYDISALCAVGLPIYVIASSNTICGGGHFTNNTSGSNITYSIATPCGNDSFSYVGSSSSNGATWDNVNGYTQGSYDVENVDVPDYMDNPSTVTDFTFMIDEDFCDDFGGGIYYVTGIINPTPSLSCSPFETTTELQIVVFCDEYVLTPTEICDNVAVFNLQQLLDPLGPGLWAGPGLPIIGSNLFPEGLAPGIYTVFFTPSAGQCNEVINTTIEIIEAPSVAIDIDISNICLLPSSIYQGILISGTQPNGIWSISPSGSIDAGTGIVDNNSLTGGVEYTISYTLTEGACTSSDAVSFTPLTSETVTLAPFSDICNQSSPIPLNTTQDGYTGVWSGTGVNMAGNSFNPNGLIGIVTLTFTPDAGQCAEPNNIDVTVVDETEVIISGIPTVLCSADPSVNLPIFQSGIQGTWSGTNVSNNVFNPSGLSGYVYIQFEPNLGQCGETPPPFEIEIIPTPDAFTIGPLIQCGDANMMASFNLSINDDDITGGADITTVTWFSDPGLSNPIPNPSDFPVTGSTIVYAVVSLNGCNAENVLAIELIVSNGVEFEISPNPGIICGQQPTNFTATITSGGPADLTWEGPFGITLFGLEVVINTAGIYEITADNGACGSEPVIFEVTTSPLLGFDNFILIDESCGQGNGSIEAFPFGGTGELTFIWNGFPMENGPLLSNLSEGTYNMSVIDEAGCSIDVFGLIIENSGEIEYEEIVVDAACGQNTGSIEIIPNGNPPFTINWSNGGNTLSINDLAPDTYYFTLTNGAGCTIMDEIVISGIGETPELTLSGPDGFCEGEEVTLTFIFTSGEAPYVVEYSLDGVIQPILTFNQNQNFHDIMVTENTIVEVISFTANGCEGEILPNGIEIDIFPPLMITDLSLSCEGGNTHYIVSFQISGGSGNPIEITPNDGILDPDGLFTSFPIEIGTDYSFSVFEMEPCPPVIVSGSSIINCDCLSSPAVMPSSPIELCVSESVTIDPTLPGVVVDPDLFQYILHDNQGNTIGNEILRTTNPTISFEEALGMNLGTTYYLSFVVGPDDGSGNVDLIHNCTAVSVGTPVTWYDEITATIIADGPFCQNQDVEISFIFQGMGPYTIGYELDGNAQSLISVNESPYTLNIGAIEFNSSVEITAVNSGSCPGIINGNQLIELIDEAELSNLDIICDENTQTYIVSAELNGGQGAYTFVPGTEGLLNGNTFVSNPLNFGESYIFEITHEAGCDTLFISGTDNCANVDCQPEDVPISLVNSNLSICPGTFTVVELNLENPSNEYSFRWNVPYIPFVISGYPLNASAGGDYSVVVTDIQTGCESDTLFFSIIVNESPMVTSFERICDDEDDFYTVVFEISGGNENNYMISPPGSGTLVGNVFTSNPIAVGTNYNFIISDGGLCIPPPVSGGSPTCNDCELEAGVMDGESIVVCFGEDVNFNYLGGYNGIDGSDTLFYVLSTDPNAINSSILFFNSTTIPWSVLMNLMTGQTYYFSAVATAIGGNGQPDMNSACLSVSNPTPFVVSPEGILTVTATEQLCSDDPLIIEFNYTGTLPYTITFMQDGVLRTFMGLTMNSVLVLDPEDFSESILITGVEGNEGCSGTLNGTLEITKVPPIEIGEITFECNLTSSTYQVIFPISGISSFDLILCGQFGIINSGVFYSVDIPLDLGYNICITNSFGCDTINVSGAIPECESCEVEAGQISGDALQIFCTSNPNSVFTITRSSLGFSNNPGEVIRFYLSRNFPITGSGDIISNSLTPSFSINNPTVNQSYFVFGIAGEDDGTGFPDLNSECLDTTNVIEIIFYRNVVRQIIVDVCPGGEFEIDGEIFDESNPSGTLTYEGMAANGCDSILMIQLEFNTALDSLYQDVLCAGEMLNIGGTIFNENNPSGQIILDANTSGDCDTIINVMLTFLPPIASDEDIVLCVGESITINGVVYDADNPTGEVLLENGSMNGCDSLVRINLTFTTLNIDLLTFNTECSGSETGSISIFDNSSSGNLFEIIINDVPTMTTLPYNVEDLRDGQYSIRVIDGLCVWDSIIVISAENIPVLNLGQSIQARPGEVVQINGEVNFTPVEFEWNPTTALSCTNCLNPFVTVTQTVTYTLTVTDANGCTANSQVSILVEEATVGVYIPNSFSPNFDGINDEFLLYADEKYISEYEMSIFNRWGDLVYSADKLVPKSPIGAWNGTFKGNRLPPDVFVYVIRAKIAGTDEIKIYAGDITLLQ